MGAGRSRSNLKQCSCMSNNCKINGQSYHAELCNHPNKYVLTRIPSMSANGMCACNTVFTDCPYNLDPLTPEEQLDEVERMYREKNQPTRGTKRQCVDNTTTIPTICCNCACICGDGIGGGTTPAPAPIQIERRNGLQNIDRCNGGCQCMLCCENVRDTRMGGLTEDEAIADAIREYCCTSKESGRAGDGGKSASCKCCACKQPHATEEAATRGQVMEEDEDYEEDEVTDAEEEQEEEEVEVVKHKRLVKEELVIEEKIQSKMREDEVTEEEEVEYIEPAPRERRRSQGSAEVRPEQRRRSQGSAEVRPEQRRRSQGSAEVRPEQRRRSQGSAEVRPEQRRRSQGSAEVRPEQKHAKCCKCCACRKKATQDKDLNSDSDENMISLEDIELEVQTDVISTQRDQFDKPTSPSNKRNSQASSAQRNRCCTCENRTDFLQETKVLMKNTDLVEESSEELTSAPAKRTKAQPNRQFDEEAMARPQRRLSEEPRSEKAVRRDQTHALGCKCCDCKRKIKETEVLKPRNEEDNRRRRRSIEGEQAPRLRETQPRRDVQDEKWQQQDAMAMAAARQQRRQSTKTEEARATSRTPSGGKRGCGCKLRNRREVASEPEGMDQEPNKSTDSEVDSSEHQRCCCCFQRKKAQPKRADENRNGGSKSCRCKEEPTATAQSGKRDKRNDNELNVSEPKTPQKKRRSSVKAASSSKEADCPTPCTCKKTKGVPLTKCCKCTEEMVHAMARERDEDTKRRELAEELAERLQKRAEQQIALQKRLQQQMSGEQSQQGCCCCCEQPPFCMTTCPCCEHMKQTEPIPLGCYEAPPCCCPPTPCCFQTPACCYEAPPCYGQECPCCCQPMPYSYSASCGCPKSGAC
ncbi:trichohyalin isoform X3 [Bactrocera dorsalis]|uniref:Trichohyalin isoform X2 n=1 Tax=Bactrocera dorsalis TaxID=27457 RepID=A0ABM3JTV3_BACDO|nr:trichohyalin isoform X2 [Bactrocera dorsalis]XP_049312663.1 trichohyalin isoform X3 [Bactrocera dorsalis]